MDDKNGAYMYYFWACSLVIFIVGLLNFFALLIMMNVLGISLSGLNMLEFLPENVGIKFTEDLTASNITVGSGILSGYHGESLVIQSDEDVILSLSDDKGPKLSLSKNEGLKIEGTEYFSMTSSSDQTPYFDTRNPTLSWTSPVDNLIIDELSANALVSPNWKDLFIQSDSTIDLVGVEGINIEAGDVLMEAGEDILFSSVEGDIIIDAKEIRLNPLSLPVGGGGGYPGENGHFKLCICLPSGLVYSIPENVTGTRIYCDDEKYSPCKE